VRVALIAPPFIAVPPPRYGGTELFVASLASGLLELGHDPVVYANGESRVDAELRWTFPRGQWPLTDPAQANLKNLAHSSWAIRDAAEDCDVIHVNDAFAVLFSDFVDLPFVHTLHHPHVDSLSATYARFPRVNYVAISEFQRRRESLPRSQTIHHGIDVGMYTFNDRKDDYFCFLGRMTPCKGPHVAAEVARRAGVRLKLAGEVQPMYRDYWEREVEPQIDGRMVEYLGEADFKKKNELLAGARALLFPIQWDEPFGLIMIEAMACGTPVVAFPGGSVDEVVGDAGVVCQSIDEMADTVRELDVPAALCRRRVETRFSVDLMARQYAKMYAAVANRMDLVSQGAMASPL
jgi:glycosyltransferase involved in cell wall biosynthesis